MKKYIQVLVFVLLCFVPAWAQEEYDAHLVGHVLFETTAVACVADVLNFQPGLRVENTCSNCGKTELRIKNVLDQFQQDIDKGEFRDANYIYGPTIPRTYFAGLSLKL